MYVYARINESNIVIAISRCEAEQTGDDRILRESYDIDEIGGTYNSETGIITKAE